MVKLAGIVQHFMSLRYTVSFGSSMILDMYS